MLARTSSAKALATTAMRGGAMRTLSTLQSAGHRRVQQPCTSAASSVPAASTRLSQQPAISTRPSSRHLLLRLPRLLSASPALLHLLASMGHGDELLLADANFPSASVADAAFGPAVRSLRLVDLPGSSGPEVLRSILHVFPLDSYVSHPAALMARVPDDVARGVQVPIWDEYRLELRQANGGRDVALEEVERFAFYERAKKCFGIVATGEGALYANIIIKKGVVTTESK